MASFQEYFSCIRRVPDESPSAGATRIPVPTTLAPCVRPAITRGSTRTLCLPAWPGLDVSEELTALDTVNIVRPDLAVTDHFELADAHRRTGFDTKTVETERCTGANLSSVEPQFRATPNCRPGNCEERAVIEREIQQTDLRVPSEEDTIHRDARILCHLHEISENARGAIEYRSVEN